MYRNWDFDIFYAPHWQEIFYQWWYGGWVISGSYYWMFLISLFLCIPVWILSLCFLLSINYSKIVERAFWDSIYKRKTKAVQLKDSRIRIKKKKSYKEIRPRPLAGTPQMVAPVQANNVSSVTEDDTFNAPNNMPFDDSMVGDGDFQPFDLPQDDEPKFEPEEIEPVHEDFVKIMENAGATVIQSPTFDGMSVDYLAIAKGTLYYVLLDGEQGNWLADEERFNDEDPLWYSEEKNRISPITMLNKFKNALQEKLTALKVKTDGHIILVKTDGLIINYEDMQDVWSEMGVLVARSNLGQPTELPVFADVFPSELESEKPTVLEKIKKIFK